MNSFPHDEFDDVPEDSQRRGAYRGKVEDPKASNRGFIGILTFGGLALLIGALMFIFQPRTLAPDAASTNAESSSSASSSPTPRELRDPGEVNVEIYNGGAYPGAAAEVEQQLEDAGYQVTAAANWQGVPLSQSMVFYSNGYVNEASELADQLGIELIDSDPEASANLYIVLGPDYTGGASPSESAAVG